MNVFIKNYEKIDIFLIQLALLINRHQMVFREFCMKNRMVLGIFIALLLSGFVYASSKSVIIDLSTQTATAYENDVPVFSGRISSGTAKRPTPTGRFRVLEKDIDHVSSSWPKPNGGAKMHYMLRLTNYGIAMHLGFVPNYPASHGCIRLENGLAQKMYNWGHVGMPVRVIGHAPSRVYGRSANNASTTRKKRSSSYRSVSSAYSKPGTKLSALQILSSSPKRVKTSASPKKQTSKSTAKKRYAKRAIRKRRGATRKKIPQSKSYAIQKVSPLDIMSTSHKAVKKVEAAQKQKWEKASKKSS